jgi:hypothetical protein
MDKTDEKIGTINAHDAHGTAYEIEVWAHVTRWHSNPSGNQRSVGTRWLLFDGRHVERIKAGHYELDDGTVVG